MIVNCGALDMKMVGNNQSTASEKVWMTEQAREMRSTEPRKNAFYFGQPRYLLRISANLAGYQPLYHKGWSISRLWSKHDWSTAAGGTKAIISFSCPGNEGVLVPSRKMKAAQASGIRWQS